MAATPFRRMLLLFSLLLALLNALSTAGVLWSDSRFRFADPRFRE